MKAIIFDLDNTLFDTTGFVSQARMEACEALVNAGLPAKNAKAVYKKLVSIVPSLDTPTCATSTKVFNERLGGRDDVVVLVVSADLPFAQGRFCQAEGTADVKTLSMMRSRNFAKDYGMLIVDGPLAGITARAALVLDEDNKVLHTQLVGEIGDEPDYDAAIAALG